MATTKKDTSNELQEFILSLVKVARIKILHVNGKQNGKVVAL